MVCRYKDADARGEAIPNQNNWDTLTDREQYIMNVFNSYTRLDHIVIQQHHIPVYLKRFTTSKEYEKDISQLSYLQYHTEVYFHKAHTTVELMKILTNHVHSYGLAEPKCTYYNLEKCKGFTGSKTKQVLDRYYESFKPIINHRNINSHRGTFIDEKI